MSFFEAIAKFFSALFGGKKQTETKTETVAETTTTTPTQTQTVQKVYIENYTIPSGMENELELMRTSVNLNDLEMIDLRAQIVDMGTKGIVHYIIHTNDRGEPSKLDYTSGDRYWECNYLYRAKTQSVITSFNGFQLKDFVNKGMQPLLYETRVKEYEAGEPAYTIPDKMVHQIDLMRASVSLTKSEVDDIEHQIRVMGSKGITHYVIHTYGRFFDRDQPKTSGDRYWECNATTIGTGVSGKLRTEMIEEGLESIFYENLC